MRNSNLVHSTLSKVFDEDGVDAISYIGKYLFWYAIIYTVVFLSIMYLIDHIKPRLKIVDNTEK